VQQQLLLQPCALAHHHQHLLLLLLLMMHQLQHRVLGTGSRCQAMAPVVPLALGIGSQLTGELLAQVSAVQRPPVLLQLPVLLQPLQAALLHLLLPLLAQPAVP
jgi:hypothetical protein